MENDQFEHKNRNFSSGLSFTGLLLIVAGPVIVSSTLFFDFQISDQELWTVGGCATLIGVLMLTVYSGTLIDTKQKRYKNYQQVIFIKIGTWEGLPQIKRIRLKSKNLIIRGTPGGISPSITTKSTIYKIFLYDWESRTVLSLQYTDQEKAERSLETLGQALKVEWINDMN